MIILTLNLHTYQENDQEDKFDEIVRAIRIYSPDFICFQECAQRFDTEFIDSDEKIRRDNMAEIIVQKLKKNNAEYFYFWDWSHYGWDIWEEGIAILSKFPFKEKKSLYISESQSVYDIFGSRRALYVSVIHPEYGTVNVVSTHLSWESEGLMYQIEELGNLVSQGEKNGQCISIVCGDFNDEPSGIGYKRFIDLGFKDTYSLATPDFPNGPTYPPDIRIDYIFFRTNYEADIKVQSSDILFDGRAFKNVSDHFGVMTAFKPIKSAGNFLPLSIAENAANQKISGTINGILLFIDISGFTAMTESLFNAAKKSGGRKVLGSETLSQILEKVFLGLIDIIYSHGGDITTFAGDAVTVVFPDPEPSLLNQFLVIFLNYIESLREIKTEFGNFTICVKTNAVMGKIEFSIVSASNQKIFYFKGKTQEQLAYSSKFAVNEFVLIDKEIKILLNQFNYEFKEINHSYYLFRPKTQHTQIPVIIRYYRATKNILSQFIHPAILRSQSTGEFRDVLSLFIIFGAAGKLSESDSEKFIKHVSEKSAELGGFLAMTDFGDKGPSMLLLWGAPVNFENKEMRAVSFALDLITRFEKSVKIGIACGKVFCGFLGNKVRINYTAFGDTINISARIAQSADPENIFISTKVKDRIQTHFNIEYAGQQNLKGISIPVQLYKITGTQTAEPPVYAGSTIGRKNEFSSIEKFIEPVFYDKFAGILYIYGEAGIGKSRMLHDISNEFRHKIFICKLPADSIIKKSLHPLISFFETYFGLAKLKKTSEKIEKFEALFKMLLNDFEAAAKNCDQGEKKEFTDSLVKSRIFIGALIGIYTETPEFQRLNPQDRYENILYSMKLFFITLSRIKPVILILEDIHWYDEDSERFINNIAVNTGSCPIAIIAASRFSDNGNKPEIKFPGNIDINKKEIIISAFNIEETENFISQLLNNTPAERLVNLVFGKSQGNPFIIEQIVRHLSDKKLLREQISGIDIVEDYREIPGSVNSIITARLDRLPPELKELAFIASVIGREFDMSLMAKIFEKLRLLTDVHGYLQNSDFYSSFTKRGKIFKVLLDGIYKKLWYEMSESNYSFDHILLRDAAYSMQLKSRLKFFHNLIAGIIEESNIGGRGYYRSLAHHYSNAENPEKSKFYLYKAVDYARNNFEMDEALSQFSRLTMLCEFDEEKIEIKILISDILENIGKWDESEITLRATIDLAETSGLTGYSIKLRISLGIILWKKSDLKNALAQLERAAALCVNFNDQSNLCRAFRHIGIIYMDKGDHLNALEHYKKALKLSREISDRRSEAWNIFSIGYLYYEILNDYNAAEKYYNESAEIFKEIQDDYGLTTCYRSFGFIYHYNYIDYDKAFEYYSKSLEIHKMLGRKREVCYTMNKINDIYLLQAKTDEALQGYYKTLKIAEEINDPVQISSTLNLIAHLLARFSEFDKAENYIARSLDICIKTNNNSQIYWILFYRGLIYFYQKKYSEAIVDFRKTIDFANENGIVNMLGARYSYLAYAYIKSNDLKNGFATALENLKLIIKLGGNDHTFGLIHMAIAVGLANPAFSEYKTILDEINRLTLLNSEPDEYFEKAVQISETNKFEETLVPALIEYGNYLLSKGSNAGLPFIKKARQISLKLKWKNEIFYS